jgi:hypothetical protein
MPAWHPRWVPATSSLGASAGGKAEGAGRLGIAPGDGRPGGRAALQADEDEEKQQEKGTPVSVGGVSVPRDGAVGSPASAPAVTAPAVAAAAQREMGAPASPRALLDQLRSMLPEHTLPLPPPPAPAPLLASARGGDGGGVEHRPKAVNRSEAESLIERLRQLQVAGAAEMKGRAAAAAANSAAAAPEHAEREEEEGVGSWGSVVLLRRREQEQSMQSVLRETGPPAPRSGSAGAGVQRRGVMGGGVPLLQGKLELLKRLKERGDELAAA